MVQLLTRLNNFLELTGWVFLIWLFPIVYAFGAMSWYAPALFIPACCTMALRHGPFGLRVAAIAGVVNMFPGIAISGFLDYAPAVWIYVAGCFSGWVICRGTGWPLAFPSGFTAKQFLIAALIPLAFSFGLGIFDFDLRLYNLIFVAVAALAIGGTSAFAVLGGVAILVLIGLFLDHVGFDGGLERFWPEDALPSNSLLAEIISWGSLRYDLDAVSDLTTAAVVFFIARYMASFTREARQSLPGRAFPPLWIRVSIIVTLLFLTQSEALAWALYTAFPDATLSFLPYGLAFYASLILAGFLLPRANFAVTGLTLLYIQLAAENFQGIDLDLGDFAYAWAFGSVGVFWHRYIKGKAEPIIPQGWLKFGVFYGAILIGNLAQYEEFGLSLIPLLWFGGLLFAVVGFAGQIWLPIYRGRLANRGG